MASQYQMSEYNLMKFGPVGASNALCQWLSIQIKPFKISGSPLEYIPMSIQCPSQVRELKSGQAVNASKKAWWPSSLSREPCIKQTSSMPRRSDAPRQIVSVHSSHTFASLPRRIHSEEGVCGLQNKFIPLINYPPTVDLQLELSVAMSSSLSLIAIPQQFSLQTHSSLQVQAKTSQSHPIQYVTFIGVPSAFNADAAAYIVSPP
ncbi:MAG TPA: hypothetical protein VGO47_13565 [Chlamydiales bacterium]|nr:hypothetical protein [Chlamydiales bacterium]